MWISEVASSVCTTVALQRRKARQPTPSVRWQAAQLSILPRRACCRHRATDPGHAVFDRRCLPRLSAAAISGSVRWRSDRRRSGIADYAPPRRSCRQTRSPCRYGRFSGTRSARLRPAAQAIYGAAQAGSHPAVDRRVAAGQIVVAFAVAQRFFLHGDAARVWQAPQWPRPSTR